MASTPATHERSPSLSQGTLVLGEYLIEDLIDRGATRSLFRARHVTRKSERFVVSTLNDVIVDRLELIEAFARQSLLLQSLRHKGIIPVVAAGVDAGQVLMVTASIKGKVLADRITETPGGLPPSEVVRIVSQIAEVLDYLAEHDPPIVHRVLEPKGVLLSATDGSAILCDVGYAHALQVVQVAAAEDIVPNAPPPYAAPECELGRFVSAAADRYSLAALAYECMSGHAHNRESTEEETTQ